MIKHKPIIAASILSADLAKLGEEASAIIEAGADWIHFDVMDNHFVHNLTFGPMLCKALRDYGIKAPIDVHLMVKPVDDLIIQFAKSGACSISFHPEASLHIDRSLQLIKDHGCQAGLVLNPATPPVNIPYLYKKLDLLLLMTVNPGFAGQKFIPSVLDKITEMRHFIDQHKLDIRLEVDGGINLDTIEQVAKAGADTFVAGTAIFGSKDYKKTIEEFRKKLSFL